MVAFIQEVFTDEEIVLLIKSSKFQYLSHHQESLGPCIGSFWDNYGQTVKSLASVFSCGWMWINGKQWCCAAVHKLYIDWVCFQEGLLGLIPLERYTTTEILFIIQIASLVEENKIIMMQCTLTTTLLHTWMYVVLVCCERLCHMVWAEPFAAECGKC